MSIIIQLRERNQREKDQLRERIIIGKEKSKREGPRKQERLSPRGANRGSRKVKGTVE